MNVNNKQKRRAAQLIKAVVFDCDGLLIDTETPQYNVFNEIFNSYDLELPLELYVQCVGSSLADFHPLDHLEKTLNKKIDREKINDLMQMRFSEVMENEGLCDGVKGYLNRAKELGLKVGLASSSDKRWVMGHLEKYDIAKYFDTIHTSDDVENIKPDPELYHQALNSLGIKGGEAIIFEDSLNGLKAAKAAGTFCVIVPNKVTSNLPFKNYDLRINSMSDISLDHLIEKINEIKK